MRRVSMFDSRDFFWAFFAAETPHCFVHDRTSFYALAMRHSDDLESDVMRSAAIDNQCSTSTLGLLCFGVSDSVFNEYAGNHLIQQLRRLM